MGKTFSYLCLLVASSSFCLANDLLFFEPGACNTNRAHVQCSNVGPGFAAQVAALFAETSRVPVVFKETTYTRTTEPAAPAPPSKPVASLATEPIAASA